MLVADQLVTAALLPPMLTAPALPKLAPAMVTLVPTGPLLGVIELMLAVGTGTVTVKLTLLEAAPPVGVTMTALAPAVRPAGTVATMLVADQLVTAALLPPMLTAPALPKLAPAMVTLVPTGPLLGVIELMLAVGTGTVTVKLTLLEAAPPVGVTMTALAPAVRPPGTVATMLVADQLVTAALLPPMLTAPALPKLAPAMVTLVPTGPLLGVIELMLAVGTGTVTVKLTLLEAAPPVGVTMTALAPAVRPPGTVATMLVADQLVTAALLPPMLTAPALPKLAPAMVTLVPTGPLLGVIELMLAVGTGLGTVMV